MSSSAAASRATKTRRKGSAAALPQPKTYSYASRHSLTTTPPAVFPFVSCASSSRRSSEDGDSNVSKNKKANKTPDVVDLISSDEEEDADSGDAFEVTHPSGGGGRQQQQQRHYPTRGARRGGKKGSGNKAGDVDDNNKDVDDGEDTAPPSSFYSSSPSTWACSPDNATTTTRTPSSVSSSANKSSVAATPQAPSSSSSSPPTRPPSSDKQQDSNNKDTTDHSPVFSARGASMNEQLAQEDQEEEGEKGSEEAVNDDKQQQEGEEDGDEGFDDETLVLREKGYTLFKRCELSEEQEQAVLDAFKGLRNMAPPPNGLRKKLSEVLGGVLDLARPGLSDDDQEQHSTHNREGRQLQMRSGRMSMMETFGTPDAKPSYYDGDGVDTNKGASSSGDDAVDGGGNQAAEAATSDFYDAVAALRAEASGLKEKQRQLQGYERRVATFDKTLEELVASGKEVLVSLGSLVSDLEGELRAKEEQRDALYQEFTALQGQRGPDVWRPQHFTQLKDLATEGHGVLVGIDSVRGKLQSAQAWQCMWAAVTEGPMASYTEAERVAVVEGELVQAVKDFDNIKAQCVDEFQSLAREVRSAYDKARALRERALQDAEDSVKDEEAKLAKLANFMSNSKSLMAARENLLDIMQHRDKANEALDTLHSSMKQVEQEMIAQWTAGAAAGKDHDEEEEEEEEPMICIVM